MSIPECVACKYALLCGGGCAQHAYYATGNMKSPVCSGFSNLFHQAVPVAYAEYLSEQAGLELDSERAVIYKWECVAISNSSEALVTFVSILQA